MGVQPEEVLARVNTHLALHRLQAQLERMNTQLAQQVVDLEEHNYELDAFAHTVAHDLKNPLMQVIGYADTLLEHEKDLPDAEHRQYLNNISRGALKMGNYSAVIARSVFCDEAISFIDGKAC